MHGFWRVFQYELQKKISPHINRFKTWIELKIEQNHLFISRSCTMIARKTYFKSCKKILYKLCRKYLIQNKKEMNKLIQQLQLIFTKFTNVAIFPNYSKKMETAHSVFNVFPSPKYRFEMSNICLFKAKSQKLIFNFTIVIFKLIECDILRWAFHTSGAFTFRRRKTKCIIHVYV